MTRKAVSPGPGTSRRPRPRAAAVLPLLVMAAAMALAQTASAKSSDRNQPMRVGADQGDCSLNASSTCVLTGNVRIVQGTLEIDAARADLRRVDGDPRSAKLTGSPVRLKQEMDSGGTMNASAAQVDYDLQADTVILTGGANVQQPGESTISGERIVYNMRTGQVQAGGKGSGRVNIEFQPRNRNAPAGGSN